MIKITTYEISDGDGKNKRRVTLAQFRAGLDARTVMARPIMDAFRRNDIKACGEAQSAMRAKFSS